MILGTGVDLVEVSRVEALIGRLGKRALSRLFTPQEVRYCRRQHSPGQHFAARFAAKEAVMKVLGTGWSAGVAWRDIEILRAGGRPEASLKGAAARRAKKIGVKRIHLSLSHTAGLAVAQAIGEGA